MDEWNKFKKNSEILEVVVGPVRAPLPVRLMLAHNMF